MRYLWATIIWDHFTCVLLTCSTKRYIIMFWMKTNNMNLLQNFWSFREREIKCFKEWIVKFKYIWWIFNIFKSKKFVWFLIIYIYIENYTGWIQDVTNMGLLDNPNQVTNSDPPKIHQLESWYIQQICGYKKIPAIVIHGNIQLQVIPIQTNPTILTTKHLEYPVTNQNSDHKYCMKVCPPHKKHDHKMSQLA